MKKVTYLLFAILFISACSSDSENSIYGLWKAGKTNFVVKSNYPELDAEIVKILSDSSKGQGEMALAFYLNNTFRDGLLEDIEEIDTNLETTSEGRYKLDGHKILYRDSNDKELFLYKGHLKGNMIIYEVEIENEMQLIEKALESKPELKEKVVASNVKFEKLQAKTDYYRLKDLDF